MVGADRDNTHVYLAELTSGKKITLVPTDGDPLLPKSLSQTFTDPAAVAIAKVAGLAVAGMTVGGPWLALATAVGGYAMRDRSAPNPMLHLACPGVLRIEGQAVDSRSLGHPPCPAGYTAGPVTADPATTCWHPVSAPADTDDAGWFCRVTDRKVPGRTVPPTLDDVDAGKLFVRSDSLEGSEHPVGHRARRRLIS